MQGFIRQTWNLSSYSEDLQANSSLLDNFNQGAIWACRFRESETSIFSAVKHGNKTPSSVRGTYVWIGNLNITSHITNCPRQLQGTNIVVSVLHIPVWNYTWKVYSTSYSRYLEIFIWCKRNFICKANTSAGKSALFLRASNIQYRSSANLSIQFHIPLNWNRLSHIYTAASYNANLFCASTNFVARTNTINMPVLFLRCDPITVEPDAPGNVKTVLRQVKWI